MLKSIDDFFKKVEAAFVRNRGNVALEDLPDVFAEVIKNGTFQEFQKGENARPLLSIGVDLTNAELAKKPISKLSPLVLKQLQWIYRNNNQEAAQLQPIIDYFEQYWEVIPNLISSKKRSPLADVLAKNQINIKEGSKDWTTLALQLDQVLFSLYMQNHKINRPEGVSNILTWLHNVMDEKKISKMLIRGSKMVQKTSEEFTTLQGVTIDFGQGDKIFLTPWVDLVRSLQNHHSKFDDPINYIQVLTGWSEKQTRLELGKFFSNLSKELDGVFNIQNKIENKLFDILLGFSNVLGKKQIKARAFGAFYDCLQSFVPAFWTEKEFLRVKKQSTLDTKSFAGYKRNAVETRLGLRSKR